MTKLDTVGNSDNFNFRGIPSFLQVCEKHSQATRKMMVKTRFKNYGSASYPYSKGLGVRLPVCPVNEHRVLMLIKL